MPFDPERDLKCRILPKKMHKPFLQGDNKGGHVASQNVTIYNARTGEVVHSHMAEPSPIDPLDPVNIAGRFRERQKRDAETMNRMNCNSQNPQGKDTED